MADTHPNALQRMVQRLSATRLGSRVLSRMLNPLDRVVLTLSGGRLAATRLLAGVPVLSVETIGARTGRPHRVTLLAIPRGDEYVLIATALGSRHHPAWYHNLIAHPVVRVTVDRIDRRFRARIADGDERQACWELALKVYPGYAAYLQRAHRTIPVLLLTPAEQDAGAGLRS